MDTPAPPPQYGRGHRALEVAGILFFFLALSCLGVRIARTASGWTGFWTLTAAGFIGYLSADFISGLVHWAGDTIGDENTPVFGPSFVTPFRYHHVDPKEMTRHDFIETNGNNCIVVAPVLVLLLLATPHTMGWLFFACSVLAFTSWFVFCTNQFHKWAHEDHPPGVVRALQRAGLILSPEHHAEHHASPQDKSYCITVGWMNPILNRTGFFRICEAIVSRVHPDAIHNE